MCLCGCLYLLRTTHTPHFLGLTVSTCLYLFVRLVVCLYLPRTPRTPCFLGLSISLCHLTSVHPSAWLCVHLYLSVAPCLSVAACTSQTVPRGVINPPMASCPSIPFSVHPSPALGDRWTNRHGLSIGGGVDQLLVGGTTVGRGLLPQPWDQAGGGRHPRAFRVSWMPGVPSIGSLGRLGFLL